MVEESVNKLSKLKEKIIKIKEEMTNLVITITLTLYHLIFRINQPL